MKNRPPIIELERTPDGIYVPGRARTKQTRKPKARNTRKPRRDQPEDPTGRLDIFLSSALKQVVTASHNPVWMGLFARFQPLIDGVIRKHLGPVSTKPVRRLRRAS